MSSDEASSKHLSSALLRLIVPFLSSDVIGMLGVLWRLGKRILAVELHEGMYQVLDYEARLELMDAKGDKAILYKQERVRFLQNNILAYQDQAWGDGQIFADYQCSPGVMVDRYREGHKYRILISLRQTKNRDDLEEFHIQRTIRNGFRKKTEDFQIEIDHPTRQFAISVIFPRQRTPHLVSLIEKNTTRYLPLQAENRHLLPDGREQWVWRTDKARLYEAYILRWEW